MEDGIRYGSPAHYLALVVLDEATKSPFLDRINLSLRMMDEPKLRCYFETGAAGIKQFAEDLKKVYMRYEVTRHPEFPQVVVFGHFMGMRNMPAKLQAYVPKEDVSEAAPAHPSALKN